MPSSDRQQPLYPPNRPQVPMVTVGEFYLYQGLAMGGGLCWAIAVGTILPAIAAPLLVGAYLLGNQIWRRRTELQRYERDYRDYAWQRQKLQMLPKEVQGQ